MRDWRKLPGMRRIAIVIVLLLAAPFAGLHVVDANRVVLLYKRIALWTDQAYRDFRQPESIAHRPRGALLICPAGACDPLNPDMEALAYPVPAERLQELLHPIVMATPALEDYRGPDADARNYSIYSRMLRAPEIVHVRFVTLAPERSSFVLTSTPVVPGLAGDAHARAKGWMAALDAALRR